MTNTGIDPITYACIDYWESFKFYMDNLGMYQVRHWRNLPIETQNVCRIQLMEHFIEGPYMISPETEHETWRARKERLGHTTKGMIYDEQEKISPMIKPYSQLDPRLETVSEMVVDIFGSHVPKIKEYYMNLTM